MNISGGERKMKMTGKMLNITKCMDHQWGEQGWEKLSLGNLWEERKQKMFISRG